MAPPAATIRPLSGKLAIVTGASRRDGIGAATCRALGALGANIFFTHWRAFDASQWVKKMLAPNAPNARQVAAPMPWRRLAPVTMASLPESGRMVAAGGAMKQIPFVLWGRRS